MPMTPEERKARNAESQRAYYAKNRAAMREKALAYRKANHARVRAIANAHRDRNREAHKAYMRQYHQERAAIRKQNWKAEPVRDELRKAALLKNDLFSAAERAVPKSLPRWIRDDVVSDIVLAILEGALSIEQVAARAKGFIAAHYRSFASLDTLSLDAPIPGTDGLTYLDRLSGQEA